MAYIFKIYMVMLVTISSGFAAMVNEMCTGQSDCIVPNSICSKFEICEGGTCRCFNRTYPLFQDGNITCESYLKRGENCSSGRCARPFEVCDATMTCACHPLVTLVDDTCVFDPVGPATCAETSDCSYRKLCNNGACECHPYQMEDPRNGMCRDAIYQESCDNGIRCGFTFVCDTDTMTCQCPEDYRTVNSVCFTNNATFDVDVGGECHITFDEAGVYCKEDLTCVRCYDRWLCMLIEYDLPEAPTTMTPGNGGTDRKGNGLCQHGCENDGICSLDEDGFYCDCADQFYGQRCQHSCSDKCGPHGHCNYMRHGAKYTCDCDAGWTNTAGPDTACDVSSKIVTCLKCTGGTNVQKDCYWIDCPHQHFCWANDKGNRYWRGCSSGCPHDVKVCCTTDMCNGYDWITTSG